MNILKIDQKIIIKKVDSREDLSKFVDFQYELYKGDTCFVPPLKSDYKKYINGHNNCLNQSGPNIKIIALRENKVCGRAIIGINEHLNEYKSFREGYISQFESINDQSVANSLFDFGKEWLISKGMTVIKGPLSLPCGDDNRGVLLDNFEDPTLIMNTYNKRYYKELFDNYGFIKYFDVYAYKSGRDNENIKRYEKLVPYAMKKHKFTLHPLNKKDINKDMKDIQTIVNKAMPTEWDDFMPPNDEEIKLIASQLVPFADPDFIYIARNEFGEPIGFNIALPDYNEVLSKLNGRLLPFGIFKFLYFKRKIKKIRFFVLFVVPEYRDKGVSSAIYFKMYTSALKKGYNFVEGSTIWEYNKSMMHDIEKYGGEIYKTYRIYKLDI
ncbi:MAG: hypothetical protein KGZ96_11165 [Clostridia bacterium]|nr:hypothetical protein [Clostridia bacterium]